MEPRKKEVIIEWNGQKETVIVRELTWGEYNEVLDAVVEITTVGTVPQTRFNMFKYRVEVLKKAIVKAPFDKNKVDKLPRSIVEPIWRAVEELNPLTL